MEVGDPDGFSRYGIVEETPDGLLRCVECGWVGEHLGLHAWKGHGITAAAYRGRHGLRRSKNVLGKRRRASVTGVTDVVSVGECGFLPRPATRRI